MFGRSVVSGLRLHQRGLRRVQIAAGNGSLGEELLAAVHDALVQVEIGLGLGQSELGLLRIFRHLRFGRCGVGRLRRFIARPGCPAPRRSRSAFSSTASNSPAFTRAALHVELFHRRADLGRDGRLRERRKDGVGGDVLGDRALLGMLGLNRDLGFGRCLFLAARAKSDKEQSSARRTLAHGAALVRRVGNGRRFDRIRSSFTSFR